MPARQRERDWDAATYDRISDVQVAWAEEQLGRLELDGDEVVLDAGCGSGRVTSLLVQRVPEGRVYGVDVAPSMVEHARGALGHRATILCQDLVELSLPEPVDAVFSNATFHWVLDHDALFARLFDACKPRAQLVAQCGGRGNITRLRAAADEIATTDPAFARYFADWVQLWNYAGDAETAERLERAGFIDVACWLEPKSVAPQDPHSFLRTVCLVRHMDPLPEPLCGPFVEAVLERMGEPLVLDYVRLNMTARRR